MSTYPHRINLRGPWQCETLVPGPSKRSLRVTMPCRWADSPFGAVAGPVRCQRRFHWPKPLPETERLFVVISAADAHAEVTLNGHLLGQHRGAYDPFEFEITALVKQSNDLCIDVQGERGLWGTVFLEVRRHCFLREVAMETTWHDGVAHLCVTGLVDGPPTIPLDVDLLLNDALLISQAVQATPTGQAFSLEVALPPLERWHPLGYGAPTLHELRLELLDVHTRLFVQLYPLGVRQVQLSLADEQVWVNGNACRWPEVWLFDAPIGETRMLEKADREGTLLRVQLPAACSPEAANVLRRHLLLHPSVVQVMLPSS